MTECTRIFKHSGLWQFVPYADNLAPTAVFTTFFAIIGAQVNLTGVNIDVLILSAIVIIVAIVSKLVGCGLPSLLFLKSKSKAMIVGVGMISRGEVGLIVAGIGVSAGVLSSNIYTTVIIMIAVTTLITPIWLRKAYTKEEVTDNDTHLA